MSLRLHTASTTPSLEALSRCRIARELEDAGKYKEAAEVLAECWRGVGEMPSMESLNEHAQAEVLLRAGVLTGFIGSSGKYEKAQEKAKDLISQSIPTFECLGLQNEAAEAYINLARCYQREGLFDEARVLLGTVAGKSIDKELLARSLLLSALIEKEANRPHDALRIHINAESVFNECKNGAVKGSYHNEFAIVLRRIGTAEGKPEYFDRALEQYAMASLHFEEAGHLYYTVAVENNVGFLLLKLERHEDARKHIDHARKLAERLEDKNLIGQIDDSKARILLAQGNLIEAEKVAGLSVSTLEKGDEYVFLAESLRTHGVILTRLKRFDQASQVFNRAVEVSNFVEDNESAGHSWLVMLEELFEHLGLEQKCIAFKEASRLLGNSQDFTLTRRLLICATGLVDEVGDMGVKSAKNSWEGFSLRDALDDYEEQLIKKAMSDAGGVVSRAARYLGIKRQLLQSKLRKNPAELKSLQTTSVKRSIMRPKNVTLMPDTFQVCLPPGRTYGYVEVTSHKLFSKGVRPGDLLVWTYGEVEENDLVAVRFSAKTKTAVAEYEYGHLLYLDGGRIKLTTDEGEAGPYELRLIQIEGRVMGFCKAADVKRCRQSFDNGGGCIALEVCPL